MNRQLLEFCQAKLGQKVGDGQCGEFVAEGIRKIGAKLRFPAFPREGDYVWGVFVCSLEAQNGKQISRIGSAGNGGKVEPGDVVQYRDVFFSGKTPTGTYYTTAEHHTAVIEAVSADGNYWEILEQNYEGKQYVVRRVHYLPDLQGGIMRVYRPIAFALRPNIFSQTRDTGATTAPPPHKASPTRKPRKSNSKVSVRKVPAKQKQSHRKLP